MIRVSVINQKDTTEVTLQIHDSSQKNGSISIKLPIRAVGKLAAMLGRIQVLPGRDHHQGWQGLFC